MKLLFCTDFSENAELAFASAVTIAQAHNAELILLHVIPEPESQFWRTYIYDGNLESNIDDQAKKNLDARIDADYRAKIPAGIPFRAEFRIGKGPQEILKFAEENAIDMIVIGRQGRGTLQSIFFGSVAERVVGKATCPVLVVPNKSMITKS